MKNTKRFVSILCLLIITNCKSQKINKMSIPIINNKSEILNIDNFSQHNLNKRSQSNENYFITTRDNLLEVKNHNGETIISYSKSDNVNYFSGYDYSTNSIIGIYKEFYSNNVLKTKGLYCWFGFKIGKWYSYNEKGELISYEDFDQGFNFTYEMVFSYCNKNNISLEKKGSGNTTTITKYISEDKNVLLWGISYYDNNSNKIIELDGKNGDLVRTFELPLPID